MDSIVEVGLPSEDLRLYFTEVTDCNHETELEDDEHTLLDEAEQATDFLQKAGLSDLSKIYQQGKEITDAIVNDSIRQRHLTEKQAQTVRSRIRTLNKTLRNRQPRRKQRQDVRDVAWNVETSSTGSRSRSATPDSLDSIGALNEELTSDEDQPLSLPHLSIEGGNVMPKGKLKWTSSEPLQNKVFHRPDRGNVAHLDSDKVVLKGYHPLNEFNGSVGKQRERSGSDPTTEVHLKQLQNDSEGYLSSSPNFVLSSSPPTNVPSDHVELSFEGLIRSRDDTYVQTLSSEDTVSIDDITDSEYQYLKALLWVEVTAIFDQHKIFVLKRKANNKRKRGNVFNVNLSTLVMRDLPTPSDNSMIPQVYKSIILHLTTRCIREDGIMRVAGQKQKLDTLCKEIEEKFYNNRPFVERLLADTNVHDLTGVLKKLLRELPDPIFTMELFDMFYKSSMIPVLEDRMRAFNLLVLLLPIEHRNTFRLLLEFFLNIIANEQHNRMSLHNVAMIIAPSFFPPRLLTPGFRSSADISLTREQLTKQINNAAICCSIMEFLLRTGENLWKIPRELVIQAQEAQKRAQDRRQLGVQKEKKTVRHNYTCPWCCIAEG